MPRPRDPANEVHRSAQERWRARIRQAGRPEVDAVDSAVTVAVAVFAEGVKDKPAESASRQRFEALERMAVDYLVALGWDRDEAVRMVYKRLHRLDAKRLSDLITAGQNSATVPPLQQGCDSHFANFA